MANGLDRFERLFSKKKPAPSRNTTASNINGSAPSASAQSDPPSPDPPVFPQAPFIRPKTNASRMHARDELTIPSSRSSGPTSSSGSRTCSWRLSSSDARAMSDHRRQSSYSSTASFSIPSRDSSLLARRHDRKPGGLVHLNIPGETTTIIRPSPHALPRSPRSLPKSPRSGPSPGTPADANAVQQCLLEALPIYPAQRYETPPPSDQDEIHFSSLPSARGRLPSVALSHFTPEHSPDMIPRRDSTLSEPKTSTDLNRKSSSAPTSRRATSIASSAALLSDDWRDSYVPLDAAVEATTSPKTKSTIQEPPVRDFMTLTDEDIAEVKTTKAPSEPPARLPPPPPVLPPDTRHPRSPPFLPTGQRAAAAAGGMARPPPLAPDEVAAFQAARIAKKYDFDFLYVVNFWPSRMGHLHRPAGAPGPRGRAHAHAHTHSGSTSSSATSYSSRAPSALYSPTSDRPTTKNSTPRNSLIPQGGPPSPSEGPAAAAADCCCRPGPRPRPRTPGITGRLLTGYGLSTLEAPFRLSAKAHRKILREGHDGWIEYRKSDARDNEFARGYARSFYTGHEEAAAPGAVLADDGDDNHNNNNEENNSGNNNINNNNKNNNNNNNNNKPAARPPAVNRGIVFAAYRRPRNHGGTVHSGAAELDALEREAETLVELILDFHQGQRRWEFYQEAVMTE